MNNYKAFRKLVKGEDIFEKFLEIYKNDLNICWYPSAGDDLDNLVSFTKSKESHDKLNLYVCSDYGILDYSSPCDLSNILLNEPPGDEINLSLGNLIVHSFVELKRINIPLHYTEDFQVVYSDYSKNHGRVFFIKCTHKDYKEEINIMYIVAENESLCAEYFLKNKMSINTIVRVRYGGGMGGGGASRGSWIKNVLKKLNVKEFISNEDNDFQSGDNNAMHLYPELTEQDSDKVTLVAKRVVQGENWGDYGSVVWNEII